ncbi:hypothetical protein ASPWEDRAFT_167964 [Aspergillus wentii DTO 134E9]|uniref:Uncharacterized protein n=1 Tax=Aspergillus wentii DTO 134E9 TaxID=1073089 RepID=A0A1L9RSV0_ASPWE|nr:uncharacterized protein ASPWEDRAFT_167964 [Aspergillus wentii DTO 134E9]KAI9933694.1 hypothetical protein MW887_004765 [Aspergillus wentii]OJJ38031.1 hypothetical protein ASPWEDRAFT_167964 [Aspergillus wentii DTO 134E9]
MATQPSRFDLPGHTLPLNFKPAGGLFPNALDYSDVENRTVEAIYTRPELVMMQIMGAIMDKPNWEQKVFDNTITSKWRDEMANGSEDVTPKMIDWILQELKCKAEILQKDGLVRVFDHGIVTSEEAIPSELQRDLKDAVRPLEDVPETEKDYHPGSDNKVVDLVHPSLFPVIYGKSRILTDRTTDRDSCLASIAQGETLAVPPEDQTNIPEYGQHQFDFEREDYQAKRPYSRKFQWLPCDVAFTDDDGCRVTSYINNLHPRRHEKLYTVIEKVLARTIPLWNETLSPVKTETPRIPYPAVVYDPTEQEPQPANEAEAESDAFCERLDEWEKNRTILMPEPGDFSASKILPAERLNLREKFGDKGLQVIVKLATIELSPEKPEYGGGSWHVEGQLNEHICATAIYYYDSENITNNTLAFRHRADSQYVQQVDYPQNRNEYLYKVFGFPPEVEVWYDTQVTQNLGRVSTHQGRLLTFPNTMQHQVSPFSLADSSKPGHRKILAFFLVDPNLRVISSANIPPQSADWAEGNGDSLMTLDQAKEHRLELMEERKTATVQTNGIFETGEFGLCEH